MGRLSRIISIKPDQPEHADSPHATGYQASRGGWFSVKDKPVPGTPKTDTDSRGRR